MDIKIKTKIKKKTNKEKIRLWQLQLESLSGPIQKPLDNYSDELSFIEMYASKNRFITSTNTKLK